MIALLGLYPNVYVDVAALQRETLVPRVAHYRYLRGFVEAGFAKRIMFGSDFLDQLPEGISAIEEAPFLTSVQESDTLCANAARFLRLSETVCRP